MLSSSRESTRKPSIMASCASSSTAWLCLSMSSKHCAQLGTQPWGLDFDVAAHSPKTVFQFAYCFCDHAENIWLLLDFARKGRALPAAPSDLASQPPPPKQAFDFEQLMGLTRGSQHGPGNEDLDALTALGNGVAESLLLFLHRLPLRNSPPRHHPHHPHGNPWTMVLLESVRGCKARAWKNLQGSGPLRSSSGSCSTLSAWDIGAAR